MKKIFSFAMLHTKLYMVKHFWYYLDTVDGCIEKCGRDKYVTSPSKQKL